MTGILLLPPAAVAAVVPRGGDKVVHAVVYGGFALLCLRAFHGRLGPLRAPAAAGAILLAMTFGLIDEWHQAFVPGREASGLDWTADAVGILLALGGLALFAGRRRARADEVQT